jgi:transcriptional regulator with XRE-family HTH domain
MPKQGATIGENIKRYQNKLGISQDVLSKKADLALNTVVKIETGESPNPTVGTLEKIAKALEVGVEELIK